VTALLDTGSEISIINAETTQWARDRKIHPLEGEGEIHLVDGTRAVIPERLAPRYGAGEDPAAYLQHSSHLG